MNHEQRNFLDQFRKDEHKLHAVDFMRIFRHYDKDKSGHLKASEMRIFLRDLLKSKKENVLLERYQAGDKKMSESELIEFYLDAIMRDADLDHDDQIGLDELAEVLPVEENFLRSFPIREKWTKEELDTIFDHYDKDGTFNLGGPELDALLRDMFEKIGEVLTDQELREKTKLLRELYGLKEDGTLPRSDLTQLLRKF